MNDSGSTLNSVSRPKTLPRSNGCLRNMRLPLSASTRRTLLIVVLRMSSHPDEKGEPSMRGDYYKEIYLESTGHPLAITPQAYEQIVALAQAHRICTYCHQGYTDTNPQVAENVCLGCFQKRRTNSPTNLIFVGE